MMAIRNVVWNSLRQRLQGMALGITERIIRIKDIPSESNELAYTQKGNLIFINPKHSIMSNLNEKESVMFVEGLFAHELMHQIATDFPKFHALMDKLSEFEKILFRDVFNVIEDPAIEYQASMYFGGHLLKSLSFMIMQCYKNCGEFKDSEPFVQFISALVHYGNGGLLKGQFGSDEAKRCFLEALPLVDKAIEETNGKKRIYYAYDVFNIAKPLWLPIVEKEELKQKLMQELGFLRSSAGKSSEGISDGPITDIPKESDCKNDSYNKKKARRKITVHCISTEEAKAMGMDPVSTPIPSTLPEGDLDVFLIEGGLRGAGSISKEEYELSPEDTALITETIQQCINDTRKEKDEIKEAFSESLDLPEVTERYTNVSCKNIRVALKSETMLSEQYQVLLEQMYAGINLCYKQLKRIFLNDQEEREYRTKGRVSIKRISNSRKTARVFNRKIVPANKSDISVMILIDESGSMRRNKKSSCARNAAIALSEVFGRLKIPTCVVGFTADVEKASVVHYHYLHWLNTAKERFKLLNISARANNFDGYSIRYASTMLKKRKEQHKLLIVLSDGTPACSHYKGISAGIKDTSDAIREASKVADVIGVAIGVSEKDKNALFAMYKSGFVNVSQVEDLYSLISQKIQGIVRNWT